MLNLQKFHWTMFCAKFKGSNLKGVKGYNKGDVNLQIWSCDLDNAQDER